jgi:hypothetical protein
MRTIMTITGLALLVWTSSALGQGYAPYNSGNPAGLVDTWYRTYLGRGSLDDPGSLVWVDQLRQGFSPQAVQAGILSSDEYYFRNGGSIQGFIQGLYRDALGRSPTPRALDFWSRRAYTEDRKDLAYDMLTQNTAGGTLVAPPPPVPSYRDGERRRDRDRWYDEHDYRRPYYPFRR